MILRSWCKFTHIVEGDLFGYSSYIMLLVTTNLAPYASWGWGSGDTLLGTLALLRYFIISKVPAVYHFDTIASNVRRRSQFRYSEKKILMD